MELGGAIRGTSRKAENRFGWVTNNVDFLYLESSNSLGMSLGSSPLTGDNYLTWSMSMKIVLGAKFN